jgi:hypothetical protein
LCSPRLSPVFELFAWSSRSNPEVVVEVEEFHEEFRFQRQLSVPGGQPCYFRMGHFHNRIALQMSCMRSMPTPKLPHRLKKRKRVVSGRRLVRGAPYRPETSWCDPLSQGGKIHLFYNGIAELRFPRNYHPHDESRIIKSLYKKLFSVARLRHACSQEDLSVHLRS